MNISIFDKSISVGIGETLLERYSLLRGIDRLVLLTRTGLSINMINIIIHSIDKRWCRQLVLGISIRRTIDLHINLNLVILLRTIKLINHDNISIFSLSIQVDYRSFRYQTETWDQLKGFKSPSGLQTDQIFNSSRSASLSGRLSIMQTDLSTHSVLSQVIKNAFSLNSRRPIKLSPRRISPRKMDPNTISLISIMLSKISLFLCRRISIRKALRITKQLIMKAFRIFISSIEEGIILIANVRRSFHQEINSSHICERTIVKSSQLPLRAFRRFLLTKLRHL